MTHNRIKNKHLNDSSWLASQYEQGRSARDIADELGVHPNTVRNRLIEFGIPRRAYGVWFKGIPKPPGQRRKISEAKKRYWQKYPATDEFKQKISKTKTGNNDGPKRHYAATNDERGKILEHRLVMEKHLGRRLTEQEQVHHIDGNRTNNDINNLLLMESTGEHTRFHHTIRRLQCKELPVPSHPELLELLRSAS